MAVAAVLGAQWGDEGKGKVVDFLAAHADMVIRFQGGDNAGHTVVNQHGEFKLHLIPSGIFNPNTLCMIGTGVVANPSSLVKEMASLRAAGIGLDNLMISDRAHLVMPYHIAMDRAEEEYRAKSDPSSKIGTTLRGIGPAYMDKVGRWGITFHDTLDKDRFASKVRANIERTNRILVHVLESSPVSPDEVIEQTWAHCQELRPHIVDAFTIVQEALDRSRRILLEGQLGAMKDLDWGTYPFVTSSNPIAGAGSVGAGIPPWMIRNVMGVVKAYTTSVGAGPMPTELDDSVGSHLRDVGNEYGATTGRPRRCGWFDAVAVKHSARLSGFTSLAITKLDVLSGLDTLRICTAYKVETDHGVETRSSVPSGMLYERAAAVYIDVPGWKDSISNARCMSDLPPEARAYVSKIEEITGVKMGLVSVGPRRDQTIFPHGVDMFS